MSVRAVIFDFDGVVADKETQRFDDVRSLLAERGIILDKSAFPRFIGKKTTPFLREEFPQLQEQDIRELVAQRRMRRHTYPLIDGLQELLTYLQEHHIATALATGSTRERVNWTSEEYRISFDVYVTGEEFHSSKPDPECFLLALEKLHARPDEIIIIEDSLAGIEAAHAAGCSVIGLTTYLSAELLKHAEHVCRDHWEVLALLQRG